MPTTTGDVELNILDGGAAVVVPGASVQVVIGCSSAGTAGQVVASRNINTIISVFGYGPLVEAAAIVIAKGGTVLAIKAPSNTVGAASAVTATALAGTSVVTVTGTPVDTYYVKVVVVQGGTIATAGIRIKVSLDAGRTYGPTFALGMAATFVITNTGLTLAFAAGTLTTNATYTFGTKEPLWNTAGLQAAINALQSSGYALVGWGSLQIVGPMSGTDANSVNGYLTTLATGKLFTRAITSARDAGSAAIWGSLEVPVTPAVETEAAWTTLVLADFSALDAKRVLVTSGHYNMQSPIPNVVAGAPKYRRPLSWVLAARQVAIQPQRHAGRVKDGSITEINLDPTLDPADGFVYHDERINPSFDVARFTGARTRVKKTGMYIANPNLMSSPGSVFTMLPIGNVMDIACGIISDVGQEDINEDIRLNKDGTIFENEARTIELNLERQIRANMTNMISDVTVAVIREWNVRDTSKVKITVTIWGKGYVLEEDVDVGFGTSAPEATSA